MRGTTPLLVLVVALGLTLVALLGHTYLPEKRLSVLPSPQVLVEPYSDAMEGGPSHSSVTPQGDSYLWRCQVQPGKSFLYCGVSLVLAGDYQNGIDLSGYHSIRTRLSLENYNRSLRLVLRNLDRDNFDPDDANAPQFSVVNIRPQDLEAQTGEVQVRFDEFELADWWKLMYPNLPRKQLRPAFDNVLLLGFDLGEQVEPGDYQLRLDSLEVVGDWVSAERWYLMILLLWVLGATLWVSHRLLLLHQLSRHHSELQEETDKYRELSRRDPLTGALNRFGFEQKALDLSQRVTCQPVSLVLLDLDHFKDLNDTYGHDTGDQVLQALVRLLKQQTRERDIVCRWGGEEFLLLCPETGAESARVLAEKIRLAIAGMALPEGVPGSLSASFGVGELVYGEPYINAVVRVDSALYSAKHAGRNCVRLADCEPKPVDSWP